jgi:hypothetical protein
LELKENEIMKTTVEMNCADNQHQDWKIGERGYIDGYVNGGTGRPLAVVVLKDRIVLASTTQLKVIGMMKTITTS